MSLLGLITVTNCIFLGNSTEMDGRTAHGGEGMYNGDRSSPTVSSCVFSDNQAILGGGMRNQDQSCPTVTNCFFVANSALAGGGMTNYDECAPIVTNCTFSQNLATDDGGGMFNVNSSPIVTNCTFSQNLATDDGGGMFNNHYSAPTVFSCAFSDNEANNGAGMQNSYYSAPTIASCTFSQNSIAFNSPSRPGDGSGGGICNYWGSSPTITNSVFTQNSAYTWYGGGMHNQDRSCPTVTNCLFVSNWAGQCGGGLSNEDQSHPAVANCTFWDNSVVTQRGGSLFNMSSSSPTVVNCILWGGTPDEVYNDETSGEVVIMFSNVQGGYSGEGNVDTDPRFVDWENSDFHLRGDSPCIDAGGDTGTPEEDIDGDLRPHNLEIDMGADEYFPTTSDSDGDGTADYFDTDDDNDGVPDTEDLAQFDVPPEVSPTIPTLETEENVEATFDLTAYETDREDGDADLTWSISGADTALFSATINIATDVLTITPVLDQYGSDTVSLTLSDSWGQTDMQEVIITINPDNDAPWIDPSIPDLTVEKNGTLIYDLTPHEHDVEDGDSALTWSVNDADTAVFDATVDQLTDQLTILPVLDIEGSDAIELTLQRMFTRKNALERRGKLLCIKVFSFVVAVSCA